jgi:hypothetical protein
MICSFTTRSVAGMELQMPGCGRQVAAIPKCAVFCAFHSRSVEFYVYYCDVYLLRDSCILSSRDRDWLTEWRNGTVVSLAVTDSDPSRSFCCQWTCCRVILCIFSYDLMYLWTYETDLYIKNSDYFYFQAVVGGGGQVEWDSNTLVRAQAPYSTTALNWVVTSVVN